MTNQKKKRNWTRKPQKTEKQQKTKKNGQTNMKHKEKHFEQNILQISKKYTTRDPMLAAIFKKVHKNCQNVIPCWQQFSNKYTKIDKT